MTESAKKPSLIRAWLLALIVACQLAFIHAGVPVVIWCPQNESSDYDSTFKTARLNPLLKELSSDEFEKSLSQLGMTEPAIVVADDLCVEDLKNNKVLSVATNGSKLHYFPYVLTPDVAFQKIYSKEIRMIEDINNDHELNMTLKDIDSSDCIALTGKQCRYSQTERIKRDTVTNDSAEFKIRTDRVLLYAADTPLFISPTHSDKPIELPISKVINTSNRMDKDNMLILTIKFADISNIGNLMLEFFFPIETIGYYTLRKVSYEIGTTSDNLFANRDIYFPFNFSYHCTPQTAFVNNSMSLNITEMQVQVDHMNGSFTDAYDCVGFTSIPIWTGIFVTAILALIMIWALTMIMDIRTMDRFDDPKGKTITISAAE